MSLWGRIFARYYDRCMAATEDGGLAERRQALLTQARGAVVEIGAGTGVNVGKYPAGIEQLVLVEPEGPMVAQLSQRLAGLPAVPARIIQAPAEAIPLPDASFDTAVATLVLCTVNDQTRSLAELRRLLKPGGRLLFIEHVRSEDRGLARWQDRFAPLWARCGHGCRCNRSTLEAIRAAGFQVDEVESDRMPKAPPIVRPMIAGSASAPVG